MNWIVLKKLNKIYLNDKTKTNKALLSDPKINYLLNSTKELISWGSYIKQGKGFIKYYEKYHLNKFQKYTDFLTRHNLLKPQTRFKEEDIEILMGIEQGMNSGELVDVCNQIIQAEETVRGVSLMFFKNEKYLESSEALIKAVKQLLSIDEFADERDQQYKYVLECNTPQCIVLCENLDFLKRPSVPRKNNIELWYAGGKNIEKLNYIDPPELPIYYSCDWDYDGLLIYKLVKKKIPSIKLLYPNSAPQSIQDTDHKSRWKSDIDFGLFTKKEQNLIQKLIENNQWIIEEANDLMLMLQSN